MILTRLFQRYAAAALVAAGLALLLTGCTDGLLTDTAAVDGSGVETDDPAAPSATSSSKLRYTHLLGEDAAAAAGLDRPDTDGPDAAKRVLSRYGDISTDTDFIVGMDEEIVLDPQRVLSRYEAISGVTVKSAFESVFAGFTVHVKKNALEDFVEQIGADTEIEWAEPDPTVQSKKAATSISFSDGEHLPLGVDQIDAELFAQLSDSLSRKWGVTLGDYTQQVHVFVLDSGITSPDVNVCEVRSFGAVSGEADQVGHGTHIAGTIGAKHNAEGVLGVAPSACLHDYRVMSANGKTMLSTVVEAVEHITHLKKEHPDWPMVVNISLGADVGSTAYNALDEAIQASIEAGVSYVLAAGNEGIDASTVTPARVEGAITVAAHDAEAGFAAFSNHGSLVDIVAPGVDVVSLPSSTDPSSNLMKLSGTSMAAAHVSGAAALYLALRNPQATPEEVLAQLQGLSGHVVTGAPETTPATRLHLGGLLDELKAALGMS